MTALAEIERAIAGRFGLVLEAPAVRKMHEATARLSRRLRLSPSDLVRRARVDPALLRELAGHATVEESYFFRQRAHYDELIGLLREQLRRGDGDPHLKIWSAGSAAGEEPYTLAILMREHFAAAERQRIDVLATDINRDAIERARAGVFPAWSLRSMGSQAIERYFRPLPGRRYQLRDDVRAMVSFQHLSLQEQIALLPRRSLDAILFRNVAIYLDKATVGRLYQAFAELLKDHGLLLISSTDPRPPRPPFQTSGGGDVTVFRPQRGAALQPHPPRPGIQVPTGEPARGPTSRPPRTGASGLPPAIEINAKFQRARTYADLGEYEQALALAEEILAADSIFQPGYLLRAQLRLARSEGAAAVEDVRRALYLDPRDEVARYWYAVALDGAGRPEAALLQLKKLIATLSADPGDRGLAGSPTTAADLLQAARSLKEQLE